MKNFEEWWKESEGPPNADPSLGALAVMNNIKKLCKKAFEAGQEYEKEKND